MDCLQSLQYLLPFIFQASHRELRTGNSESPLSTDEKSQQVANNVLATLHDSRTVADFHARLQRVGKSSSWTENIAIAILQGMEKLVQTAVSTNGFLKEVLERAVKEAAGFATDHPYYTTLIALGMLVILMPWVVEALGFSALGPVEGSWAALWQATYRGFVPKRSLFSYLQRMGMTWR